MVTGDTAAELREAAQNDGLELRFRTEGEAYERAKSVADRLSLDMQSYLLLCLREGNRILRRRAGLEEPDNSLDSPAIVRRPPPQDPERRRLWEQARGLFE